MLLQPRKAKESHFVYILLLLVIAIIGYWQISFLKYSVTHDMINCWIPWRHYLSDSIQNHIFPFWNPYQQLGYPIHADLQGPTWYLESLLLSMTIGQDNYVVQLLFVFYAFLAGMGMYFLSLCFHRDKNVAFITGVCYMLGGFFVAHVQHLYAIIGAAWLPFIILNYYRMVTERDYKRALYASVFMFFNLTGGNHTFTFILCYLFASIGGYYILVALKEKKKDVLFQLIRLHALFVGVTSLLAAVVLVVFVQVKPYIGRLSGMTYKDASLNPLSPQSLLSLFTPLSTVNSVEFFNTDPSMCNVYIGVIILPFILLALVRAKTTLEKILYVFAFVCLLASFGAYTPVHKLLFDFFPGMNLFRFPSYFSLFTVLILLVLGGKQLANNVSSFIAGRDKLVKIITGLMVIILILVVAAIVKNHGKEYFFFSSHKTIFDFIKDASLYQSIVLQGTIQILFLTFLLIVVLKVSAKFQVKLVMLIVVVEMLFAVQLNIAYVGFSPSSPKELKEYLEELPTNYPVPSMNNISDNTEEMGQKHGLYRNTSGFHKRISADVFNSFCFKNQVFLLDSLRPLYDSMLHNPLVYFSNHIFSETALKENQLKITHKTIVLSDEDYKNLSPLAVGSSETSAAIAILSYAPTKIVIGEKGLSGGLINILQAYYTGWKAYVDGEERPIVISNFMTMSVYVPAGKHKIEFVYENKPAVIGGIISYSVFFIVLIVISFLWWRERKNYLAVMAIWIILAGTSIYYFFQ